MLANTQLTAGGIKGAPGRRCAVLALLWLIIALFFCGAVFGVVINYTAVPFWDMWNGYLGFYYQALETGWPAWWEQHNEHRLVLAKVFFWIDLHWFKGNLIFLFVLNLLFSSLVLVSFYSLYRTLSRSYRLPMLALLSMFAFSWVQKANYLWAFQSQFYMAQLLPLWAFIALAISAAKASRSYFIAALLLGVLSVGTMANGLLVLPLLALMSLLLGHGKARSGVFLLASIITGYLYFQEYSTPYGLSVVDGLKYNLYGSLIYFFKYLAGPINYLFKSNDLLVALFGFCAALLSFILFFRTLFRHRRTADYPFLLSLFTFLAYVAGSALSTAFSRSLLSMEIQSRYMTPALMGWSALAILFVYFYLQNRVGKVVVTVMLSLFLLLLLPAQLKAYKPYSNEAFSFRLAAVAVALNIPDSQVLARVYFNPPYLFEVAKLARADGKSIFSQRYIVDIPVPGSLRAPVATTTCDGQLEQLQDVPEQAGIKRIKGWLASPDGTAPDTIVFSHQGLVVGYAVSGERRKELKTVGRAFYRAGFQGYLLDADYAMQEFSAQAYDQNGNVLCGSGSGFAGIFHSSL